MAFVDRLGGLPGGCAGLGVILDPGRGVVPPPIRSEIFGLERFARHGRSLAETHEAAPANARAPSFFPRLRSNIAVLREAHRAIGQQALQRAQFKPVA